MKAQIIKTVYIEAARREAGIGLTGNSYRIDLVAEDHISNDIGWVVDYADLKALFEPIRQQIDHHCLTDIPGLESDASPASLENWINAQLQPWPDWFAGVRVFPPEPRGFVVSTLPADPISRLPERFAFSFSAAQSLPQLPAGHPCRELHGHTYQLELACRDASGLHAFAEQLYSELHGRYLNEISGLEQATAERIAMWVWERLQDRGAQPVLVGVQETPNNRCYYFGL